MIQPTRRYSEYLAFGVIVLVFIVVRLPILWYHDVAYTYDQARDFLSGVRIVVDHNPVFIGPTTGVDGLFHGAWWYYFTGLSYLLFGSEPIRYYVAILLVHLIGVIFFYASTRRLFGVIIAMWGALHIATIDYFVSYRIFAGNNIFAAPFFMLFCLILMRFPNMQKKSIPLSLFLFGLAVGFVAEFELAFGIFLLPLTLLFLVVAIVKRYIVKSSTVYFLFGLLIPFTPRLLFELKNNFLQTRILLSFFSKPKLFTPRTYPEVLDERIHNFIYFFKDSFGTDRAALLAAVFISLIAIILLFRLFKRRSHPHDELEMHTTRMALLVSIMGGLFLISLWYRDTFWNYYYEGIQFAILLLFMSTWAATKIIHRKMYVIISVLLCCVMFLQVSSRLVGAFRYVPGESGLMVQESIVQYIVDRQKDDRIFCVRVFVPPVIPYTYDYLWLHHYLKRTVETPRYEYQKGTCWYIIEPEQKGYEFRLIKWKEKNIPIDATLIKNSEKIIKGISVSQYEQKTKQK